MGSTVAIRRRPCRLRGALPTAFSPAVRHAKGRREPAGFTIGRGVGQGRRSICARKEYLRKLGIDLGFNCGMIEQDRKTDFFRDACTSKTTRK